MGQFLDSRGKVAQEAHYCLKEIPRNYHVLNDGSSSVRDQPVGLIFRCSCGKLWTTVRDLSQWSIWQKAGWRMRYKYRHDILEKESDY